MRHVLMNDGVPSHQLETCPTLDSLRLYLFSVVAAFFAAGRSFFVFNLTVDNDNCNRTHRMQHSNFVWGDHQ